MKPKAYQNDNTAATEVSMENRPTGRGLLLRLVDFLLLNIAFLGVHWFKYQSFSLTPIHKELMMTLPVLWFLTTLPSKKFSALRHEPFWTGIGIITRTNLILIILMSLTIISLRLMEASRIQAYGSCLLFYGLEVMGYLLFYTWGGPISNARTAVKSAKGDREKQSLLLFILGGASLFLSFIITLYIYERTILIKKEYIDYAIIISALWIVTSIMTGKYNKNNFEHLNLWLSSSMKSIVLMAGGVAIISFGTRFFTTTRFVIFGPLLIYFLLDSLWIYICFLYFKYGGDIQDLEDVHEIGKVIGADRVPLQEAAESEVRVVKDPVVIKLENALEFLNPKLFDFINSNIDLSSIGRTESVLISTDNLFNVHNLYQVKIQLFINLHKLNDMRWFNKYFLSVHSNLVTGGYFVGHAHTIETKKIHFEDNYPKSLSKIFYALHFLLHRVMPKLPWMQKFYFALTKGRNRTVSMAEVFGRLYFCGFKVVAERVMNNRLYFIAQKIKGPSLEKNPTYGPVIRLKRFCGGKSLITVYKFRTMYPYSEFLQQYIYERNKLDRGGKFKEDFRVTAWGSFLRKTWLDELPMLYNWIRGDLKLIGVRPLSNQYLSLYNPQVRQLREKVKPGLIPPFYADLPESLEEIQESEKRYIESYFQRPLLTQLTYLYKSVVNIIINRNRSA